jgi:hypothetical protein
MIAGFWDLRIDELKGPQGLFSIRKFGNPEIRQFIEFEQRLLANDQRPRADD